MSLVKRNESNNSSSIEQSNHLSTASFPRKTKCEFCNVNFRCDLDVSRHLASPTHRTKRDEHLSLLKRQEKTLEKKSPRNLKMVYDALKLRTAGDLQDLIDKDYFVFSNENATKIADAMVQRLSAAVFRHESKNVRESYREARDEILQFLDTERPVESIPQQTRPVRSNDQVEDRPMQRPVERQERKKVKTTNKSKPVNRNITERIPREVNPPVANSQNEPAPSTSKEATSVPTCSHDTPGASTSSINANPETQAPSTSGPQLGQNWGFKVTFAKIKVEPKD